MYKDEILVNKAFSMLTRFFTQRHTMLHLITSTQILENEQSIQTLQNVTMTLEELRKVNDSADFWMGGEDEASLEQANTAVKLLENLTSICVVPMNHLLAELQEQQQPGQMGKNILYIEEMKAMLMQSTFQYSRPVLGEHERPEKENQWLLRNLKAGEVALMLVKQKRRNSAEFKTVLRAAYSFLIRYVRGTGGKDIFPYIQSYFLEDIELGVGACQLISELYRNNPKLVMSQPTDVIKAIIDAVLQVPLTDYEKAVLMDTLRVFSKYKEQCLVFYQNEIISQLANPETAIHILHLYYRREGLKEFRAMIKRVFHLPKDKGATKTAVRVMEEEKKEMRPASPLPMPQSEDLDNNDGLRPEWQMKAESIGNSPIGRPTNIHSVK